MVNDLRPREVSDSRHMGEEVLHLLTGGSKGTGRVFLPWDKGPMAGYSMWEKAPCRPPAGQQHLSNRVRKSPSGPVIVNPIPGGEAEVSPGADQNL